MTEGPPKSSPEYKDKEKESSLEATEEKPEVLVEDIEKLVKYARFSAFAGMVTLASIAGKGVYDRSEDNKEYQSYIESTFSADELREYEIKKNNLIPLVGEEAIRNLEAYDQTAFLHRNDAPEETRFEGFDLNGDKESWWNVEDFPKFLFTEDFDVYPKGWINGEISKVVFKNRPFYIDAKTDGDHSHDPTEDRGLTIIYDLSDQLITDDVPPRLFSEYTKQTFAHETGHANDWETKSTLNLLERVDMLQYVLDRMESDYPFRNNLPPNELAYHETFLDGTENGRYRALREYWAILCKEYFIDPERLKTISPEDFDLVHKMVEHTDPDFDVFDPDRGAHDSTTGAIRDKWKSVVEDL